MTTSTFLTAQWRHLAMINWEIDPGILEPLVPRGTELHSWDGRCFVSLVGFLFLDTRLLGVPVPAHRNFEEVNLRFYVRRRDPESGEVRRAVVFVREIVPKAAIARIARWAYNERYVAHPMRHDVVLPADGSSGRLLYGWEDRGQSFSMEADFSGDPEPLGPGSEAEFIAEHYWGYVTQRDGSTVEYQVEHPPWRAWTADRAAISPDTPAYYGSDFRETLASTPSSTFVAEGSAVTVHRPRRLSD